LDRLGRPSAIISALLHFACPIGVPLTKIAGAFSSGTVGNQMRFNSIPIDYAYDIVTNDSGLGKYGNYFVTMSGDA
jgi:hypothetical protein